MNRRTFLKTSAAAGLTIAGFSLHGADQPGKKFRTALIGCGWWGNNILREAMASGACKIVGLCDVDERALDATFERVTKDSGDQPAKHRDYRGMLEMTQPEIVIVATPDHWHAIPTIAAMNVGAHVYVEKPISHTINEGKAMVKVQHETGRVVQVGTHRRISPHNVSGREFIRSGKAGKIGMVRCFVNYGGGPEKPQPNS
ncbi:MAG: Gfo/Idh/MocA family oxidoreductase, partial [Verrucomicrobiae bacterium]|nr:Gfo/Idh/MocA family oxidoreductase [Verrucomicrobiae bacterium]